jgi:hypothetical protein
MAIKKRQQSKKELIELLEKKLKLQGMVKTSYLTSEFGFSIQYASELTFALTSKNPQRYKKIHGTVYDLNFWRKDFVEVLTKNDKKNI